MRCSASKTHLQDALSVVLVKSQLLLVQWVQSSARGRSLGLCDALPVPHQVHFDVGSYACAMAETVSFIRLRRAVRESRDRQTDR